MVPCDLPELHARVLIDTAVDCPALPVVLGITGVPILRPDGSLHAIDGYDPQSRLILHSAGMDWSRLRVPERPTKGDAEKALEALCEPLQDFPFVDGTLQPTLSELLKEAVALHRTMHKPGLHPYPSCLDEKLSAGMYLREALDNASLSESAAQSLRERLDAIPPDRCHWLRVFRDSAAKMNRETRAGQGCALRRPSGNWQTLVGGAENAAALAIECAQHGTTPAELIAVEVLAAAREAPEIFGTIDLLWDKFHAQAAQRQKQLEALCEKIPEQAQRELCLDYELIDEMASTVRVVYRIDGKNTGVVYHPLKDSGARLVTALAKQ